MTRFIQPGLTSLVVLICAVPLLAQNPVRRLVTSPIDETKTVAIHGTVHPLAQLRYDLGAVPDSLPANRMFLVLQRPAEREADLQQFLQDLQNRSSTSYHQWLTPQQFGQRFGPAGSDVQIAVAWLQSHGFDVARVSDSKTLIEFSGTVGQLRSTFHTQIHQYVMNGETHYANANDISIPAALAPLVRGTSPLNDFRVKPLARNIGPARYSPSTKQTKVQWTVPNPKGSGNFYALAPKDFATQYDLTPVYQAGVDGTGQTIGIINVANIDVSRVNSYRQLFSLPSNPPQVLIDGSDPGGPFPLNIEAYLDVELSGAVAPNATVNLYISDGGSLFDPLTFAALRAIEDNQASVLSVSFGACEQSLGQNGNQLFAALWQQAAAQGQTVFVSAGDSGSAGCDPGGFQVASQGLAVNGVASTPWDIAVGGTDFYYSDYASGAPSATGLWSQTNDSSNGSLIASLPEQVWNEANGFNVNPWLVANDIGGGGGASSCSVYTSSGCAGYPKPNWQTGPGVPNDGVRDLPDVSLFAADGLNLSAYPICVLPGDCVPDSNGQAPVLLVGGTSASSPAMRGIMALINQKYGRQGQAGVVLYPLAQQIHGAFHDITIGGNNVPAFTTSQEYLATSGYDQASGLGSLDANVLVENWNSIQFLPTSTSLKLSSATITHGQGVRVSTAVTAASGTGTPTGNVAILTDSPLPSNRSQLSVALANGAASATVNFFPGGTYHVFGNYGGDDVFGMSKSSPVVLTVKPENATLNFAALALEQSSSLTAITNGGTVPYGSFVTVGIQPTGVSAPSGSTNGIATGTASFTLDSNTQTVPLDSIGLATWALPTLALGSHIVNATYSGDNSFNPGNASQISFTVAKGNPVVSFQLPDLLGPGGGGLRSGDSATIGVAVRTPYPGVGTPPTGTVSVNLGNLSQTVALSVINGYESVAVVTFPNLAAQCYFFPSASYPGDSNWLPAANGIDGVLCVSPGTNAPTTTAVTVSPSSISGFQTATFAAKVSAPGGSAVTPRGFITFFDNGDFLFNQLLPQPGTGTTASITVTGIYPSQFRSNGVNLITAVYSGDCCYSPSTSAPATVAVVNNAADFTLAAQLPQTLIKAGSSGDVALALSSIGGFNDVVNLTCAPSSANLTCSVNPPSLTVNGFGSATLSINALPGASPSSRGLKAPQVSRKFQYLNFTGVFIFASLCLGGAVRRRRWIEMMCSLALFAALLSAAGCGGGGGGGQQTIQPPPPPPLAAPNTAYYSVLVTGAANGVVHNSQIIVAVQ